MATKKLIRRQACWVKFLLGFNFVISYTSGKENQKSDSLTCRPNYLPIDDTNDHQQYLLQTIFLVKKLEISSIEEEENCIIVEQIVQANQEDSYCSKLCNALKTGYSIEKIDLRHFFDLLVDSENYIC